jgi:hypothetical protein
MSVSAESCQVCERKPCCRVLDLGTQTVRVCAACAAVFRFEPELLRQAVRRAADEEESADARTGSLAR